MNLEDLKENLKTQWEQLLAKIQDNPSFISLKDRFDSLPNQTQKIIQISTLGFGLLVLMWIPYSRYLTSADNVSQFEEKRDLVRDLLRVSKESAETALNVSPPSEPEARSRIESALSSAGVLPEQKAGINPVPLTGNMIKAAVVQTVLETRLTQLNLTQALNVGLSLARIQGTKLKDLVMEPNTKAAGYFDVTYKLVVFKNYASSFAGGAELDGDVPPPPPPPGARGNNNGAGRPRGRGSN